MNNAPSQPAPQAQIGNPNGVQSFSPALSRECGATLGMDSQPIALFAPRRGASRVPPCGMSASCMGTLSVPVRVPSLAKNGDSGLIQTYSGQKTRVGSVSSALGRVPSSVAKLGSFGPFRSITLRKVPLSTFEKNYESIRCLLFALAYRSAACLKPQRSRMRAVI